MFFSFFYYQNPIQPNQVQVGNNYYKNYDDCFIDIIKKQTKVELCDLLRDTIKEKNYSYIIDNFSEKMVSELKNKKKLDEENLDGIMSKSLTDPLLMKELYFKMCLKDKNLMDASEKKKQEEGEGIIIKSNPALAQEVQNKIEQNEQFILSNLSSSIKNNIRSRNFEENDLICAEVRNLNSKNIENIPDNKKKQLLYYFLNNKERSHFDFKKTSMWTTTGINKVLGIFKRSDIREIAVNNLLTSKTGSCHDIALAIDWALDKEKKINRHLIGFRIAPQIPHPLNCYIENGKLLLIDVLNIGKTQAVPFSIDLVNEKLISWFGDSAKLENWYVQDTITKDDQKPKWCKFLSTPYEQGFITLNNDGSYTINNNVHYTYRNWLFW